MSVDNPAIVTVELLVRARTGGNMADREAAERLKQALRIAMTQKGIETWGMLGMSAGVTSWTIENWIYARTVPRSRELRRVGEYLRPFTSPADLEAAYSGIAPPDPPLIDVLRDLAPDLHELVVLLRAQADQELLEAVRVALEERRRGRGGFRAEPLDELSAETET